MISYFLPTILFKSGKAIAANTNKIPNTTATYTYKENEVFCIEIHNQNLASIQKQLFDFIWQNAEPLQYLDNFGTAKLI